MNSLGLWGPGADLAWWTITVGAIVNTACALLGCYLVLRRLSLLGDAISHAVLPGIVLAYMFAGRSSLVPLFLGAMATGMLTALLVQTLKRYGGVAEDAGMGVTFTALFAVGVLLISNFASRAHIDADCVLYGDIDSVPLDLINIGPLVVPRVLPTMVVALAAVAAFIALFWKELKLAAFDPTLATAMGLSAGLVHYLLMGMTAVVTVAAFEAVGAILSVAMLIVPAATAHLLTDRLGRMLAWSAAIAVMSSFLGYLFAVLLKANVAGMIAVAAGGQFALAVLFAPRHGIASKVWNTWQLSARIMAEDMIALLYRMEESKSPTVIRPANIAAPTSTAAPSSTTTTPAGASIDELRRSVGGGWIARLALGRLQRRGDVHRAAPARMALTDQGRRAAESLIRSHRLWEAYLTENFQLPLDHLHEPAEKIEHFIGPELQQQLAASLPKTVTDPHGREIPPAKPQG